MDGGYRDLGGGPLASYGRALQPYLQRPPRCIASTSQELSALNLRALSPCWQSSRPRRLNLLGQLRLEVVHVDGLHRRHRLCLARPARTHHEHHARREQHSAADAAGDASDERGVPARVRGGGRGRLLADVRGDLDNVGDVDRRDRVDARHRLEDRGVEEGLLLVVEDDEHGRVGSGLGEPAEQRPRLAAAVALDARPVDAQRGDLERVVLADRVGELVDQRRAQVHLELHIAHARLHVGQLEVDFPRRHAVRRHLVRLRHHRLLRHLVRHIRAAGARLGLRESVAGLGLEEHAAAAAAREFRAGVGKAERGRDRLAIVRRDVLVERDQRVPASRQSQPRSVARNARNDL
eukprot:3478363-Rhodomonas_salina.2